VSSYYQHQIDGALWLAGRDRGLLGDLPGLGKTRTIVKALDNVAVGQPFVICPAIARTHWRTEFQACDWRGGQPLVRSYEEIQRGGNALMKHLLQGFNPDALVLDEFHRLSHATAKRTRALMRSSSKSAGASPGPP